MTIITPGIQLRGTCPECECVFECPIKDGTLKTIPSKEFGMQDVVTSAHFGKLKRLIVAKCPNCDTETEVRMNREKGRPSQQFGGFDDPAPITKAWLLTVGFEEVPSDTGPSFDKHLQKGRLNVWDYNQTGRWCYREADHIELSTRGELRMMAALLKVEIPN